MKGLIKIARSNLYEAIVDPPIPMNRKERLSYGSASMPATLAGAALGAGLGYGSGGGLGAISGGLATGSVIGGTMGSILGGKRILDRRTARGEDISSPNEDSIKSKTWSNRVRPIKISFM